MKGVYIWILLLNLTCAELSVPLIFSNHIYVEDNPFFAIDMKMSNTTSPIQNPKDSVEVIENTKGVLNNCLSDAYIIVKVPGLILEDFQEWKGWEWSRRIMSKASTIVSIGRVINPEGLELKQLEKSLRINCDISKIEITAMEEPDVAKYADTKSRLIDVSIPADVLYAKPGSEERVEQLMKIDDLIYKVAKKLPTPNIFILITSTTPEEFKQDDLKKDFYLTFDEVPEDPRMVLPSLKERAKRSKRWIWPDITVFDRSRWFGFERNIKVERNIEKEDEDDTWLSQKTKDNKFHGNYRFDSDFDIDDTDVEKKLPNIFIMGVDTGVKFDKQFIVENALLIAISIGLVILVIFVDLFKLLAYKVVGLFKTNKKTKKPNKEVEDKKTK